MERVRTTCPYCGVGCGVIVQAETGRIVGVEGDPDHPANAGRLCSKGSALHLTTDPRARLLFPEARGTRNETRMRVSWDGALDLTVQRFAQTVREHGPDSVAFYVSGQLLTEDYYVFNKLARALVGTNNIDSNSRLCMSSAVTGYKATLGADAPPACYEDIDVATCLFIAGSNTAYAHPVLFRRIEAARARNPELKLIVVDPRRTDTAAAADLHLAILPGTDVALFNAMLHVMLWEGLCDSAYVDAHTKDFARVRAAVAEYTPRAAAALCGIGADDIVAAARLFAGSAATLSLYCQGLNQSVQGTEKNAALINLHLATGQIGRAGAGPLSLTGQPNAMGGREVGAMATLLSGHRDLGDPSHRDEMARLWNVSSLSPTPGKTAVEMFDALREGSIKAIWIACTNPAQSLPDQARVAEALRNAEFVVLQEAFAHTETAQFADVLLPATTWGEKAGTVTNSERRISRVRSAVPAPGEARQDWRIVVDFAHRFGDAIGVPARDLFPYENPQQIFEEHRETTRGRDLDITGIDYALLETRGPQQWPFPEGAVGGAARLYEDGRFPTADGRARFVETRHRPTAEKTDARHPLHLNTVRLRDQWHGMSRTGTAARLYAHAEEPVVSMNAADMKVRRLVDGDLVRLRTRRGELNLRARASDSMRPGQASVPMHWGSRFVRAGVNALTVAAFDPVSRQPELKHAAVQIEKLDLPWQVIAMRSGDALRHLEAVRPLLEQFPYASCGLLGRDQPMVVFRAAASEAVPTQLLAELDAALDLPAGGSLDYHDTRRGIAKRVLVEDDRLVGVRLCGETAAHEWLRELMASSGSVAAVRRWVLAPVANVPGAARARGRVVCSCFGVPEADIQERLVAGLSLAEVQEALRCGTNCGSCLPELRRMAGALAIPA